MKLLLAISFVITLTGCAESFIHINPEKLNALLAEQNFSSAAEVGLFYFQQKDIPIAYRNDPKIITDKIDKQTFTVTIIEDINDDDSVSGEKTVLMVICNGTKWKAISISQNWRCFDYRGGNSGWGAEPCP